LMITAQSEGRSGLKQSDIARTLARDKAVITRLIASLVDKQLLVRQIDDHDRRAFRVLLSDAGADAVAHLKPQLEKLLRAIYRDIDQQEFEQTRDVLGRVLANLESIRDGDHRA